MLMWFFNALSVFFCFLMTFMLGGAIGCWAQKKTTIRRMRDKGVTPSVIEMIEAWD